MDSSAQFRVAKQVQDLVGSFLPPGVNDAHVQRYVQYCMRILSSRIQPLAEASDKDHIKMLLVKQINQKPKPKRGTIQQELVRFEELHTKFQRTKSMTKTSEILHLMLQLSNDPRVLQSENGNAPVVQPAQGSVIESVFSSKLANQVAYRAQKQPVPSGGNTNQDMQDEQSRKDARSTTKQRQLDYLRTLRFSSPQGEVNEDMIVRELLFVFQGIDGVLIKYQLLEDAYVLSPQVTVSPSTHKLISELCELGWLFRKVSTWVQRNGGDSVNMNVNQVTQSLCFAIQAELTEYYRLLAVLDSQRINYSCDDSANYLNLRKLYLWVQEPLERMKWLAVITDLVQNLKGGAICSAINTYVLNGSPSTKHFISRILKEVSTPILSMIKTWMVAGEINDPFQEFFVETDPNVGDDKLWTEKYKLNYVMIPAFLTNNLANKILQTGKAVNFIRRCCDEQDWILDVSLQAPFQAEQHDLDINKLKQWVETAHEKTNKQLLHILFTKYQLEGHCAHIRKYLLMAQGDMMEYLIDLLADELTKSASDIYKHTMRAYLDTAIRSSNAQFHKAEFISRLDVKLLQASEKDRGWETFLLDYKVSDLTPLSTIFTEEVMNNYNKIFSFMLKLKKIQHSLSLSWGITMSNQKQFRRLSPDLQAKFHRFNLAHHEMAHFVSNIHNYILVEVLQSAWSTFLNGLHQVGDLDSLIILQKKFVSDIIDKALLSDQQRDLYKLLQRLLNCVFTFTLTKEKYVYTSALQESERLERVHRAQQLGQEIPEEDLQEQIHYQSIERIEDIHAQFFDQFIEFKDRLQQQNSTNLKYLLCRLDFNEFYQIREEQKRNFGRGEDDDMDNYGSQEDDDDEDEDDGSDEDSGEDSGEGDEDDDDELDGDSQEDHHLDGTQMQYSHHQESQQQHFDMQGGAQGFSQM